MAGVKGSSWGPCATRQEERAAFPKFSFSFSTEQIQNKSRFLQKMFQLEKEQEFHISGEGRLQSPDTLDEYCDHEI